jgi:CRP-like cAMP-binding protein
MQVLSKGIKNRKQDVTNFIAVLNYFHPISDEIIAYFEKKLVSFRFKKGVLLLKQGNICKYIYFIEKGAVRGFIKEGKRDITTWITTENEMVTSIYSLDLKVPALENMEAIEDCNMLALKSEDLQQLYKKFPEFNIVGRKLLQQYYRDAERRAFVIRHTNAVLKYRFFLKHYSHLANRIPLTYIASFLGIVLETLSRVRKKMASKA